MRHDKGKVSIVKPVIISSKPSDDMVEYVSESPNTTLVVSTMIMDSPIMEVIVTPGILASSSREGKQFIMPKDTPDI